MSRSYRLTPRAEQALVEIALWTMETFGGRQADFYESDLIERCGALARGEMISRSCGILVDHTSDLRYARVGEHFLIFLDDPEELIIIDFLHSRSDLPRHIAALEMMHNKDG